MRWLEVQRSLAFIGEQLDALPEGRHHSSRPVRLAADQAVVTLIEGWRGEICHVAITGQRRPLRRLQSGRSVLPQLVRPGDGPAQPADFRFSAVQQEFQSLLLRSRSLEGEVTMFDVLLARWKQGHRTMRYPAGPPPELPERFAGRPTLDAAKCKGADAGSASPSARRPPSASAKRAQRIELDTGRCLFCRQCETACDAGAIAFSRDYRLAASRRDDLDLRGRDAMRNRAAGRPAPLDETTRRLFGRSLKLRQVSAGGCNACEADTNVLGTVAWDLGRFGIQFVASPRHADGLLITGPVPENMRLALQKTYEAVPCAKTGHRGGSVCDFRRALRRSP